MSVACATARSSDVELKIYEPPRFFEAFLRGRPFTEAPDITARICGICPVAYQMSACTRWRTPAASTVPRADSRAAAAALLRRVDREPRPARLHAPRAGLPRLRGRGRAGARPPRRRRARPGAEEDRQPDDDAGRRPRDPPDQRPRRRLLPRADRRELPALVDPLERAREAALETVRWVAGFDFPERAATTSSSRSPARRRTRSSTAASSPTAGSTSPAHEYDEHFVEEHVEHSNALHSRRAAAARTCRPAGPLRPERRRLSPVAQEAARDGRARRPAATRSAASSCAASSWCTRATRRCGSSTVRGAGRARRGGRTARRRGYGAPRRRAGCCTTATGSTPTARSSTRRSCRRPRRTSSRSRRTCAASSAATRSCPTTSCALVLRAGDPQLRPVHLVRDPLPRPGGRAPLNVAAVCVGNPSAATTPRAAVAAGRGAFRTRRLCGKCEQEPTRLLDAWSDADVVVVVDAAGSGAAPAPCTASMRAGARAGACLQVVDSRVRRRRGRRAGPGAGPPPGHRGRLRHRGSGVHRRPERSQLTSPPAPASEPWSTALLLDLGGAWRRPRRGRPRARDARRAACRSACASAAGVRGGAVVTPGPLLFARYAYPPNALGLCGDRGAPGAAPLRRSGVLGRLLGAVELARSFEGA